MFSHLRGKYMNQRGFTLIELVIVIVILGILAVTAAPKFLDLTDDAEDAVASGVLGAVNSAAQSARAAWLVAGSTGNSVTIDGDTVAVENDNADADGYPTATAAGIGAAIVAPSGWSQFTSTAAGYIFVSTATKPANNTSDGKACVAYNLNASDKPVAVAGSFTFVDGAADTCA
ncbi:type II secretion system protein [Aliiglaciecola sp. CAU 1673]|uniref:type II secretion system protein n=1 Tax=Aliiglaciecola sp. CAU 1673 TaxID=3032595 RepID=UPI0023DA2243|nr:type II secretion system protein [Aliiglaciecola sp. CAU 1673]MDF2179134.1 type II secretion system protein [Aliiglaciecola sp. CAU 1673]